MFAIFIFNASIRLRISSTLRASSFTSIFFKDICKLSIALVRSASDTGSLDCSGSFKPLKFVFHIISYMIKRIIDSQTPSHLFSLMNRALKNLVRWAVVEDWKAVEGEHLHREVYIQDLMTEKKEACSGQWDKLHACSVFCQTIS